jgi:hypothetical protein
MPNGSDIIIKGGSCEITFHEDVYPPDPKKPNTYANAKKKIVRVQITGDIDYDSGGEKPDGLHCDIVITCR